MNIAIYGPSGGSDNPFPEPTPAPAWVRNPSWLPLPTVTAAEEKVVILVRLDRYLANTVGFTIAGAYTVDWGDGSAPSNHASNTFGSYTYDATDAQFDDTCAPVVLNATADTVERTAHGYLDGDVVSLYSIVTTTGVTEAAPYYVVNKTANNFQLSLTPGGAAINMTGDGTAALLPYKQVILTITPQASQSLTVVTLTTVPSGYGLNGSSSPWLDILASCPNMTNGQLSHTTGWMAAFLERVRLLSLGNITSLQNFCRGAVRLREISFPSGWGASVTNAQDAFVGNFAMTSVGRFIVTGITNTVGMFQNCNSLQSLPDFNFSGGITTSQAMFANCFSLETLGNVSINLASATNTTNMFSACYSLKTLPQVLNVSSCTNATGMFSACGKLVSVPSLSFVAPGVNLTSTFSECRVLETIDSLDVSGATVAQSIFDKCSALRSLPVLNFSSVNGSLASAFRECRSLTSVTISGVGAPTTVAEMFNGCWGLQSVTISAGSFAGVTSATLMFSGCYYLELLSMPLDFGSALTNTSSMFNTCSTLGEAPMFYTGHVTNAGSMFQNCSSIRKLPLYNFSAVTTAGYMFTGCSSLDYIPVFNFGAVVTAGGMFHSCSSLVELPAVSFASVTSGNFGNMFNSATSLSRILATGFKFTFSVGGLRLSAAALDEIYTNLPVVVGQTITVSGNPGVTGDNPTIATAKGWAVTG